MINATSVLPVLERYYDTVPRAAATVEELGPFTLFLRTEASSWPYYARPRLGLDGEPTAADVAAVRARQRELGVPEQLEWVDETTPGLISAARAAGLLVHRCPLLVLPPGAEPTSSAVDGVEVRTIGADDDDLELAMATVGSAFTGEEPTPTDVGDGLRERIRAGLFVTVAAYSGDRLVGGGSHSPRDGITELVGIGVLPDARRRGIGAAITHALVVDAHARGVSTVFLSAQDDAVARVYERVGFVRVATACIAEPAPEITIEEVDGDDWERWRELRLRALQDSPAAYGSTYAHEAAMGEDHFRARLDGAGPAVLALLDGVPVGMGAGFEHEPGRLLVVAMWVDPAHRGRRVGERVLDAVVARGRERRLVVELYVAEGNDGARRLYERYGFRPTGQHRPVRDGATELMELLRLPADPGG